MSKVMKGQVRSIFEKVGGDIGFKKKLSRFYRDCGDLLQIIELRRSQWGAQYSIWLGIAIKELSDERFPPVHRSHVQSNVRYFLDNEGDLDAALNEEDFWRMAPEDRGEVIKLALTSGIFYFFNVASTLDQMKCFIMSREYPMLAVKLDAKQFFKLDND